MPPTRHRKYNHNKNTTRKRISAPAREYVEKLKQLYPSCRFDGAVAKTDCDADYSGHNITYGEMEYDGIQQLYEYASSQSNSGIDAFIDVGSGRGKLCMYMASKPAITTVMGIELVSQRHDDAIQLKTSLKSRYANKVEFINSDVLSVDLRPFSKRKVFVWFSNLCFEQSTTNDVFQKLADELPKGSILCCSKAPLPEIGHLITTLTIPMSWSKTSQVYVYEL